MGPPAVELKEKKKRGAKQAAAAGGPAGGGAAKRSADAAAGGSMRAGMPKKRVKTKKEAGSAAAAVGQQAWEMGKDEVKGRIMIATRDLAVGDVILDEEALVVGSWHEHRCSSCCLVPVLAACAHLISLCLSVSLSLCLCLSVSVSLCLVSLDRSLREGRSSSVCCFILSLKHDERAREVQYDIEK